MKIRRTKNLLYIFSSVMVLGLALISFDAPKPAEQTVALPTPTPTAKANTPTPVPTQAPEHTATPTPTPSLAELNAAIAIQPATDDTGAGLTTIITNYLNDKYSDNRTCLKYLQAKKCLQITDMMLLRFLP